VVDEAVGQHHRPDLEAAVEQTGAGEEVQHLAGKPADRPFLDDDQHLVLGGEAAHQLGIERLGEARVGEGGRQTACGQLVGCLAALAEARSQRQDRHH
jgi:hypothetical protein